MDTVGNKAARTEISAIKVAAPERRPAGRRPGDPGSRWRRRVRRLPARVDVRPPADAAVRRRTRRGPQALDRADGTAPRGDARDRSRLAPARTPGDGERHQRARPQCAGSRQCQRGARRGREHGDTAREQDDPDQRDVVAPEPHDARIIGIRRRLLDSQRASERNEYARPPHILTPWAISTAGRS